MNLSMEECMRWFGPNDPVPLQYLRQAGAKGVFSSLHEIPYGEVWSSEAIQKHRDSIEEAGLNWSVVESLPVHEDIKSRKGNYIKYIKNYNQSLRNLGSCGLKTVVYNFMPVLDWVRTDMSHKLEDGSECLYFNPVQFAAFEIYILKRHDAEKDYNQNQIEAAKFFYDSLGEDEKQAFVDSIIDVFPGMKMGLKLEDIRKRLEVFKDIDKDLLKEHLKYFLDEVLPVAEEAGVRLAIHPDDPPFPILGLPRILCNEQDIMDLFAMNDSNSNGLCFCSGSLSPNANNDLPGIVKRHGSRIHAVHLRSVSRHSDGSFNEADHLGGYVNMPVLVKTLLSEMKQRKEAGRMDWKLPLRPDHGQVMMDDLKKETKLTPGYSAIGRMKGLAELRGLQMGLQVVI